MLKKVVLLVVAIATSFVVYGLSEQANTHKAVDVKSQQQSLNHDAAINKAAITQLIEQHTRLTITEISASQVPGLAEVLTNQGYFYASYDGKYFVPSKIYGLSPSGLIDINQEKEQKRLAAIRLQGLEKFKDHTIEYKADNEKYVVTAFTDITCGYCRKMHSLMDEYNDLGITVRYLAYPRQGVYDQRGQYTQGFKDLRSIWCHENPAKAMNTAKAQGGVEYRECDAPIADEFTFGGEVGVNGTPALLLENGYLLPGFREPKDLVAVLENL